MINLLRKRHVQIWMALSLLLPAGIIGAWLVKPQPVKDHLLQPPALQILPVLLKTSVLNNYTINIKTNADTTQWQLEWENKKALTFPSALIYKIKEDQKNIEDGEIIGRIDGRGIYHFPLKKDSINNGFHFVLYDIIHHQIIDRINF
jgi:hypothetical protein